MTSKLSVKRILLSGSVIAIAAAVVIGATGAFFSDEESSTGNTFTAGAIDLQIDNESYVTDVDGKLVASSGTSWDLSDLTGQLFFNFNDLKPGDVGEDTISLHVNSNDAWACMNVNITDTPENEQTEPEADDDDTDGVHEGELQEQLNFVFWADDGDNVLETDEAERIIAEGTAEELFDGTNFALADSQNTNLWGQGGPLQGDSEITYHVGKAWCFGELTKSPVTQDQLGKTGGNGPLDRGTGISCNGAGDNSAQTDGILADVTFSAIQSRNNSSFVCERDGGIGCNNKSDVMFVLDSSGSIDPTDLGTMKTAAQAFAVALAPSAPGNHIGVVDFDSDATLEQTLTEVLADINNAINSLVSGGSTALGDGINVASVELASVRDRLDSDAPDFMVIMTDGQPNAGADPIAAATAAKAAGTTIYVVGIGDGVNADYLRNNIASSSSHYYSAADFASLESVLAGLASCNPI